MTRIAHVTAIALVLLPTAALAQQQRETFKDANGRTLGWSTTGNGSGGTSYYDSMGRSTGRSVTSGGTTTVYDNMGRQTGTIKGSK